MRPRSVGTFLISRPDTSAKLSARPRMRSMSSRVEVVDGEQVPSHAPSPPRPDVADRATSSSPSSSSTRTLTRSLRAVGRFLPT